METHKNTTRYFSSNKRTYAGFVAGRGRRRRSHNWCNKAVVCTYAGGVIGAAIGGVDGGSCRLSLAKDMITYCRATVYTRPRKYSDRVDMKIFFSSVSD
jgi:hypothetical protein